MTSSSPSSGISSWSTANPIASAVSLARGTVLVAT